MFRAVNFWQISTKSVTSNYDCWVTSAITFRFANLKLMTCSALFYFAKSPRTQSALLCLIAKLLHLSKKNQQNHQESLILTYLVHSENWSSITIISQALCEFWKLQWFGQLAVLGENCAHPFRVNHCPKLQRRVQTFREWSFHSCFMASWKYVGV